MSRDIPGTKCIFLMELPIGAFNSSPQPHGTPIITEVANIGYTGIQVTWKDANRQFVSKWCDWDPPTAENGSSNNSDLSQPDGSG